MPDLVRFSVCMEKDLLSLFDEHVSKEKYASRSEAIKELIRKELIRKEWAEDRQVAGVISFVYDHHKKDMSGRLTDIQHDHYELIVSSQHIHLDHDNCLEIIAARGLSSRIRSLADAIKVSKGVKDCQLTMTTMAKEIK
jgi:CopG family transcriptional regulator, nickel-responsive regulator